MFEENNKKNEGVFKEGEHLSASVDDGVVDGSSERAVVSDFKLRSMSDLFKRSFGVYAGGFKRFVGMSLVAFFSYIPLYFVMFAYGFLNTGQEVSLANAMSSVTNIVLALVGLVFAVLGSYGYLVASIGIYVLVKNFDTDQTIRSALRESRREYVWKSFVVSFLISTFVLLGVLLFVLPGVFLMIILSFSMFAVVNEGYESTAALKRSMELAKGKFWSVFLRYLGMFVLIVLISICAWYVDGVINPILMSLDLGIKNVVVRLLNVIVAPFFFFFGYFVYRDLVDMKGVSKVVDKKGSRAIVFICLLLLLLLVLFFVFLV